MNTEHPRTTAALAAALSLLAGCAGTGHAPGGQRAFPSAEAAVLALVDALRGNDSARLAEIFGPEGADLVSSGDPVSDKNNAATFVQAYDVHHELVLGPEQATLVVGADDWELPIPVVRVGEDWCFDTEAGKDEILARRIGENELSTIQVCRALVDAQEEYLAVARSAGGQGEYAQKFRSDDGTRNGLYWDVRAGEAESPLGPLVAQALAEGYGGNKDKKDEEARALYGYRFHMLTAQGDSAPGGTRSYLAGGHMTGGFAVVAWPAQYDASGVMTFLVSDDGVVYQRDLGPDTDKLAQAMTAFDPGPEWAVVPE